jgi:pyruvate kinase
LKGHNAKINFLSKKDKEDIDFGIKNDIDFIAASFVRELKDIKELRNYISKKNSNIRLISKIEHPEALNNINDIIENSQGIMVARGDLAVEIPMEQVPKYQKQIIKHCNELGKPVIVATQMLESMKDNPRPTRAEISDVAQAILEGTDAIMLSSETTIGKYPVESVKMMSKIANEYDKEVDNNILDNKHTEKEISRNSISMFVTKAAYVATTALEISAIITPTESGYTARKVSRFKPKCPIISIVSSEIVLRQLQLSWGVFPYLNKKRYSSVDKMVYETIKFSYAKKLIKKEDKVVITSGHTLSKSGFTNSLEIYRVKEVLKN